MEYGRIKPIEGENGYEKTSLTMKSIAQLLAEEGTDLEELKRSSGGQGPTPRSADQQRVQEQTSPAPQPPVSKSDQFPPLCAADGADAAQSSAKKPRSFLKRLFGG